MMKFAKGNLLEAPAQALVNAVNTVGVMGSACGLVLRNRLLGANPFASLCYRVS